MNGDTPTTSGSSGNIPRYNAFSSLRTPTAAKRDSLTAELERGDLAYLCLAYQVLSRPVLTQTFAMAFRSSTFHCKAPAQKRGVHVVYGSRLLRTAIGRRPDDKDGAGNKIEGEGSTNREAREGSSMVF